MNPLEEKIFENFFRLAEIANFTSEERETYEDSLKYYRDIKNVVDTSKEEGIKEGMKEGIKEGIKEGMKEGMKKGIKEIALNMLEKNINPDLISELTGLSKEEIHSLRKEKS